MLHFPQKWTRLEWKCVGWKRNVKHRSFWPKQLNKWALATQRDSFSKIRKQSSLSQSVENIFVRKYLFLNIQALITGSVGNICCENVLLPHRCNSISAPFCEVNLSTAIFFAFKKFFVVSHFIALWFICILLWVFFFCCYSCDSNLFYCEKSHCEHPLFAPTWEREL